MKSLARLLVCVQGLNQNCGFGHLRACGEALRCQVRCGASKMCPETGDGHLGSLTPLRHPARPLPRAQAVDVYVLHRTCSNSVAGFHVILACRDGNEAPARRSQTERARTVFRLEPQVLLHLCKVLRLPGVTGQGTIRVLNWTYAPCLAQCLHHLRVKIQLQRCYHDESICIRRAVP